MTLAEKRAAAGENGPSPGPHGPHPFLGYMAMKVVDVVGTIHFALMDLANLIGENRFVDRLAGWSYENCSSCPYCGAALLRPARFDEHVCR